MWAVVECLFSLRFQNLPSFKIREKKIEYFFQNRKGILPKFNNGIQEKVFQQHNNDIMTVWEWGRGGIEMDENSQWIPLLCCPRYCVT